ncbi:TetR/AcrR family transcriptional regulator [Clavibacter zhangzhiyongii]|uniref:TetR/AcrR family transcriptional regulator n=1 Tax=Clavibacter zhangzhiyongii TaxID=2768071 RepID=UPI0039E00597
MPPREHRPQDERRRQLIDAAVAVMTEEGVAAVTTRAVTTRAGLPHGSFHYCFDSKADLFSAMLSQELRTVLVAAFDPPAEALGPVDRIAFGLRARLALVTARPDHALALVELTALSHRDPALAHLARWEQAEYRREVTRDVDEWTASDGLRWSAPTPRIAALLIAVADGIANSWLADRDDEAAQASIMLAARSVAALLDGSGS